MDKVLTKNYRFEVIHVKLNLYECERDSYVLTIRPSWEPLDGGYRFQLFFWKFEYFLENWITMFFVTHRVFSSTFRLRK